MSDFLLLALVQYGLPILGGVILLAAIGLPVPVTLLLLVAGALVRQAELSGAAVLLTALTAAVSGDQIGYALGRWGSARLITRAQRWGGGPTRWARAEAAARRWGGPGIFLTRWLLTPLGPLVNVTSGVTRYPWPSFVVWDVVGEAIWIGGYVGLGWIFSDQTDNLSGALGNFTWVVLGGLGIAGLVHLLRRRPAVPVALPEVEVQV